MTWALRILVAMTTASTALGQGKVEFEAASIRVNPLARGFHFSADASSGGPGTSNPGLFRCSNCTLATLIRKAFDLQNYQFPGRAALGDSTFEVMARIPSGATADDFKGMLQNLLKERFGLTYHFREQSFRGYQLVIGKNGAKLRESGDGEAPTPAEAGKTGHGAGRRGLTIMWGSATFRDDHQTTGDLARVLADQLSLPVEDKTELRGKYDIELTWSGQMAHSGNHAEGGSWGGAGHSDHVGGGPGGGAGPGRPRDSGPALFDALQSQLGLRLVRSEQTTAQVLVVDHVSLTPTEN